MNGFWQKLGIIPKLVIFALPLIAGAAILNHVRPDVLGPVFSKLKGGEIERVTAVPERSTLPVAPAEAPTAAPSGATTALPGDQPGCTDLPEVRALIWAWNAQMGWMLANGGVQSTVGSLMCTHGVNLRFIRQDDPAKMRESLLAFAEELKRGVANPANGAHFVAIMGDGGAGFIDPLNASLAKLGYDAKVIGSAGWSRGEDKFMGLPKWKQDPQAAKGALIAGYVGDGDWNIAVYWAAENDLCNNPDWKTWDPECINWVNADSYVDAANKYVANYCEPRPEVRKGKKTGKTVNVCVNGVVTWTPGDVTVAEKRGGLVSIWSTKQNASQMPNTIIGVNQWMRANRATVEGMLAAITEGGDQIKADPRAVSHAAAISAKVYGEYDAQYWEKYFYGTTKRDAMGLEVELGGSAVSNLADNLYLFGLKGGTNLFAATFETFGRYLNRYYPDMLAKVPLAASVVDASYLEALAARATAMTPAATPRFDTSRPVLSETGTQKAYRIEFASGSARITPKGEATLAELRDNLAIATGVFVQLDGHTDTDGDAEANQTLSIQRAHAVKAWLKGRDPVNFPDNRFSRVSGHGESSPAAFPETTPADKARNRRVEITTYRSAQ